MFRSRLKSTLRSKQTDICNVLHRHLTLTPELSFPYSLQLKWTLSKQTNVDLQVFTQKPLSESIMDPKDEKDCEISNSSEEDLTRMGKFVRFLVRIYFLPLKLGDDQNKTTFSLCSLPTLLNFLFYYLSSVSLICLASIFYFSEEKRQTTMKSSGVVDILSGLSFHTTILLLFPGVPLLFGQVISNISGGVEHGSNLVTSFRFEQVILERPRYNSFSKILSSYLCLSHLCVSGSFEGFQYKPQFKLNFDT